MCPDSGPGGRCVTMSVSRTEKPALERPLQWAGGWPAVLFAALLYSAGLPRYGTSILALLVPGVLLTSVRGLSKRAALAHGAVFALVAGCVISGGWSFAFVEEPPWTVTVAVCLACVLPYALMTLLYSWWADAFSARSRPVLAAWLWVGAELFRSGLFSELPWHLLGETRFHDPWLAQIADLGGVYAASFAVALISVGVAELFCEATRSNPRRGASPTPRSPLGRPYHGGLAG